MEKVRLLKISRLEGLTDGVFAIAMTLLALDLKIPIEPSSFNLGTFMLTDIPNKLIVYVGSFVILGTLWIAMNFQTALLERINRPYMWTWILYLMFICIVPFSASLVATYPKNSASISFYAVNLLCSSLTQFLIIETAYKFKLTNTLFTDDIRYAGIKRVFIAPGFYVLSLVVAHWKPTLAFILLVIPIVVYMFPGRIDKFNS